MSEPKPSGEPRKRKRRDRWIGTAQVFVDIAGYARAVLVNERDREYLLLGPLDCCGDNMELKERRGKEGPLKRLIEKELREAGY